MSPTCPTVNALLPSLGLSGASLSFEGFGR
jgi:hypothetical protein